MGIVPDFRAVLTLLAARYGFDFELMLRDKKTLFTMLAFIVASYVGYVLLLDKPEWAG